MTRKEVSGDPETAGLDGPGPQPPLSERAQLAEALLHSLEELDDAENERLWVEEAERRYAAYKAGKTTARPADEVFQDLRK